MGDVTECGLKGYPNRYAAKQAARAHHDNHVRPYECRDGCGWWHVGVLPARVIRGEVTAGEFYADREQQAANRRSPAGQLRRTRLGMARLLDRDRAKLAEMWADTQSGDRENARWKEARDEASQMITQLQELVKVLAGPGLRE